MKTKLLLVAVAVTGAVWAAALAQSKAPAKASKKIDVTQSAGIAAKYPDDKGIIRDPAVILHEDFEAAQIDKKRWPSISNKAGALKLVRDPASVHGGRQALQITATLGKNTGGHLFRRFKKGYDQLYTRFCVKFAEDCDYTHHFVHMVAQLPPTSWPTGGAGLRPAGDKKFSLAIEPWGKWGKYPPPGGWHFYCYWWKMKPSGDGKFWGRGFADKPYAIPKRGQWYCVEFMGKANTPGKEDGEIAVWIDGKKLAHHRGINWRSSEKLKINSLWLMLYVTAQSAKKNKVNTVWFDDVVVATEYIGPPRRK